MPALLQSDFFVIGLISFFALLVNKHERVSAIIYASFCWVALLATYAIPIPDFVLGSDGNEKVLLQGWYMLISAFFSLLVIALVYAVRQCKDGRLPRLILYMCYAEILLHITCFSLLLNGMDWMTYNWAVLANQIIIILLFAARGGYGRTILRTRLFRDSVHSH